MNEQEIDFSSLQEVTDPVVLSQLGMTQAQINTNNNKNTQPDPENPTRLTPKDLANARTNWERLNLAEQYLNSLQKEYNNSQLGTGIGSFKEYLPGFINEDNGRFDQAIDTMRSTIQGITKVPGVGAISDFETKLEQAKFPNRWNRDGSNEVAIQGLKDLIESGRRTYGYVLGIPGYESPRQQAMQSSELPVAPPSVQNSQVTMRRPENAQGIPRIKSVTIEE